MPKQLQLSNKLTKETWYNGKLVEFMTNEELVQATSYTLAYFFANNPCFPLMKKLAKERGLMDKIIQETNSRLAKAAGAKPVQRGLNLEE
jgi:hypothetical protein